MNNLMMMDLPAPERPRERMLRLGARSLADRELLAILLRTGKQGDSALTLAEQVLRHFDDYLRRGCYPFYKESGDDFQSRVAAPAGDEDNLSGKTIHHASFSSTARYNGSVFVPTTTMSARMTSRLRPWRTSMSSDGPE